LIIESTKTGEDSRNAENVTPRST